jgi:hypothetical protein
MAMSLGTDAILRLLRIANPEVIETMVSAMCPEQ